jgi:dolichyl-phosphate-mannose-protein mannosyltransferase
LFFFIGGFALFSWQVHYPISLNFDEFHYMPAAKAFLYMEGLRNLEHPPLAKLLMALGIKFFGDNPLGWRIMSVLFGALTLSGMYLWAVQLFKRQEIAVWTALLTLVNFFLFVQSRIAMLDTFMFAFLVFAGWAFTAAWDFRLPVKQVRKYLALTGIFLGLAMACKWFSLMEWAGLVGLYVAYNVLNHFNIRLWPAPWKGLEKGEWVIWLIALPTVVYFLTFFPFLFAKNPEFSFFKIFTMQKEMWDLQKRVVSPHPYMSQWYTWAIMKRPIWYAFDKTGPAQEFVRGVFLVGNPLLMLSGIFAIFYCFWDWMKQRRKESLFIVYFYFLFYGSWALIPRAVAFYYYYYPAAMILSFAVAIVLENRPKWIRWSYLVACAGLFIYFYPVLAAVEIPIGSYIKWMWLRSWI